MKDRHRNIDHACQDAVGSLLTVAPIGGLVRQLAIPASVGFFFNTLLNVVDTYFAGMLSTDALAALSLSFPVFFSLIAMGSGFSTGATALIGQALGAGRRSEAARVASQGLMLSAAATAVVTAAGYAVTPALFRLLGASDAYLAICLAYIRVILLGSGFVFTVHMLNGMLTAQGDTRTFRDFLIAAAILNVGLDAWFLFGGLGVPAMGVAGIALATIVLQGGGVIALSLRVRRTGLLARGQGVRWRPHWRTLRAIIGQGVPASLSMMSVALGIFIVTWFVSRYGQDVVAAYGVATRIEQIAHLPAIGLNVAAMILAAQNGGARKYDRVRAAVRTCLGYGAMVAGAGTVALFAAARPMMSAFSSDPAVIEIGVRYLQIAALIQYAYVILMVNTSTLQGLKLPIFALWIGLYRHIAAPLGLFWLVTQVLSQGLMGIWWSLFGISWSAAIIAAAVARRRIRQIETASAARNAGESC
ncbi:MAG: MATE family efflux transporter [Candidatus Krumholzibacteria bacterium]|jgi:putative MATE family efflux protein|nr:MATE family efflux transporter [Candidatus Krumholzibacteria bacterium]